MSTATHERVVTPIKSFTVRYNGETLTLRAGISYLASTHPVVLAFPRRFGLSREAITVDGEHVSEVRSTRARPAPKPTAARTRVAPAAPIGPTLPVRTTSGGSMSITLDAAAEIREECRRWGGKVETGGGLCWNREYKRPWIIEASVIASGRERDAVRTDLVRICLDRRMRARQATARLGVGFWHSHPGSDPTPSPEDLALFQRLLDASRDVEILALIATEDRDGGWQRMPRLHGFRVSYRQKPSGLDALIVQQCDVEQSSR